jgi:hypothetical protein
MKYYRMLDDLSATNRWFLGEVGAAEEIDIWDYCTAGQPVTDLSQQLTIDITNPGVPLNITFSAFDVLVGDEKTIKIFKDEEVQKIPLSVQGETDERYYVMVVTNGVDCIDRDKSEFTLWEEDNDIRPDLAGTYRMISKIVVDGDKMGDLDIVRVKDFDVAIIVSERLKKKITDAGLSGVKFEAV